MHGADEDTKANARQAWRDAGARGIAVASTIEGGLAIERRRPRTEAPLAMSVMQSVRQWRADLSGRAALDLWKRVRLAVRDTKHYALRELTIRRYLLRHPVRKLQLGTGGSLLEGWLNTDQLPYSRKVAFLDATRPFPLPDASIDFILSEHHIEHISYPQATAMLRECARVLRPGGRIRIATPDLEQILRLYRDPGPKGQDYIRWMTDRFLQEAPGYSPVFVINLCMRLAGHQFLYDGATLTSAMSAAGLVDVERLSPGFSRAPELYGIDSHEQFTQNAAVNEYETMVYEARKP
jgi:predicted SAM-dependent methyltransferase